MQTYTIHTYGCQMNVRDSETLAGFLQQMDYAPAQTAEDADIILFNTCCIREHAAAKVIGNVGALRRAKAERPELIIGVCGCMMQLADAAKRLMLRYPFVDFALCPQTIDRLPDAVAAAKKGERSCFLAADAPLLEGQPRVRAPGCTAFVNIMAGCNNYCTYCVVPYVRGRERSRQPGEIIGEISSLVADGVREVTLLGQNVNSYQSDGMDFARLLGACAEVEGLLRLRFMTSNPHDFTDDIIQTIAGYPNICNHVHLPVQSGDNRILRAMNRRYTREDYLDLVGRLRAKIPDLALTTDFIVGFPGEDEAAFAASLSLVQEVEFDAAYIFLYSSRPGTAAAVLPGQLPVGIIKNRHAKLLSAQEEISRRQDENLVGQTRKVLIEQSDKRSGKELCGREEGGRIVRVTGGGENIGRLADVLIERAGGHTLQGVMLQEGCSNE